MILTREDDNHTRRAETADERNKVMIERVGGVVKDPTKGTEKKRRTWGKSWIRGL